MKNKYFTTKQEEVLLEQYCLSCSLASKNFIRTALKQASRKYRKIFNESFLNQTDTNEWISAWLKSYSCSSDTKAVYLGKIHHFWQWLFQEGIISCNILRFSHFMALIEKHEPKLTLPKDLHRLFHEYSPRRVFNNESIKQYNNALYSYIRFIAQHPNAKKLSVADAFTERRVHEFLIQNAKRSYTALYAVCCILKEFINYLIEKGEMHSNPITLFLEQHGCSQKELIIALRSKNPKSALLRLSYEPRFQSVMANEINAYIEWKRSLGYKFVAGESRLHAFDIFLCKRNNAIPITNCLLNDFIESQKKLAPVTRNDRLRAARSFCSYLQRFASKKVAVNLMLSMPNGKNQRLPYIIMPQLFRLLIEQVRHECEVAYCPLTESGVITVLELLYATGLRIGEVFRLKVKDVNLNENTLFIRKTKFNKDRIVPFADSVRSMLENFLKMQNSAPMGSSRNQKSFFAYSYHFPVNAAYVSSKFRKAAQKVCGFDKKERKYPRIHDLRHSFAVRRLLQWYQEGYDVQNRLPVLSTYLGHVDFISTQKYITMIPELLHSASYRFNSYSGNIITINQ